MDKEKIYLFQLRYIAPFVDYVSILADTEEEARDTISAAFKKEAKMHILRSEVIEDETLIQEKVNEWSDEEPTVQ